MIIFNFLLLKDVFKFKFLSRRANSIYFLAGKELGFLINHSKKIFDVDDYYEKFQFFFYRKICF